MSRIVEAPNNTAYQIYESIEEIANEYGMKQMKKLVSHTEMTNEELREHRARVQATKELLGQLRSGLGYTVDE